MSRQTKILAQIAATLALLVAVCVGAWHLAAYYKRQLTTTEAERLVRASEFIRQSSTTKLVLYKNSFFPASDLTAEHPEVTPFMNLGLVAVKPATIFLGNPLGAVFFLTPEGERAAAGWQRSTGPRGEEAWIVPTALKELVEVQAPLEISDTEAECSFTWKWNPNLVGKAVGAPDTTETSSARLRLQEAGEGEEKWFLEEGSIR